MERYSNARYLAKLEVEKKTGRLKNYNSVATRKIRELRKLHLYEPSSKYVLNSAQNAKNLMKNFLKSKDRLNKLLHKEGDKMEGADVNTFFNFGKK
jgi:predicted NACHT family NTPase